MLQLQLNRVDYCKVNAIGTKCMKLMPSSQKETQKICVGDSTGCVQLFSIKQREPVNVFKTLPNKRISRIELGGKVGSDAASRDRIFASSISHVTGYSKKGKQFFNFETNMTEPIKAMAVAGDNLCISGNHVYNLFKDGKEIAYYMCQDKINDVILLPFKEFDEKVVPVLACNDRILQVLDDSMLAYGFEVSGPPTTLELLNTNGGLSGREVLYGTSDGKVGLVELGADEPVAKWQLANEKRLAGVTGLHSHDVTNDGVLDLLVSREDGTVELYSYESDTDQAPLLKYTYSGNESVASIQGGCVGVPGCQEIVVSTFNGWIFGLVTDTFHKEPGQSAAAAMAAATPQVPFIDKESNQKMNRLREELDRMQNQVLRMRETYQTTLSNKKAYTQLRAFQINYKFELNKDDASYTLAIDTEVPIDNVLLQCNVPIDLLDSDKNSCVLSYSECEENDGNFLLVTCRCQTNTNRLEVKVRTIEGQHGTLRAYITSRIEPKNCIVKQYVIKPLSLHQKCHAAEEKRPVNRLRLTGQFSMAEMHSWLLLCIPEFPEKLAALDEIRLSFVNVFLGTQLHVAFGQNEANFTSENVSTISILKDFLTKKATDKNLVLNIELKSNPESTRYTLKCIHPMIDYHITLAKKYHLIDALKELAINENSSSASGDNAHSFLIPEYQEILLNAEKYIAEYKRSPSHLERLYGMVTDLYIDQFKFMGQNAKNRIPNLIEKLDNYDPFELLKFFEQSPVSS